MSLPGQARIALSLVVENISDKPSQLAGAKDDGRAAHRLAHDRRFGPARQAAAGVGQAGKRLGGRDGPDRLGGPCQLRLQQGPVTLKALDAVASFLADWKSPKGPLVLGLKPAKTAGLADLDKIMVPDALTTEFGFTATYPATKEGAAKAGATAAK